MRTTETDRPAAAPRPLRRAVAIGATAGALALLTAACGGSSGGSGSTAAAAPAATTQAAQASGTQVKATLTEFHIALSQQKLAAGTYTFVVTNSGNTTHALSIDGPGLSDAKTADLSAGQTANLTVTLHNGTYDFYCPVDHHKQLGMNMNVSVAVGGGSEGGGATPAPTTGGGGGGGNGY